MKLQLNKSVRVDFHWLVRLYSQIIQLIYLPKKKKKIQLIQEVAVLFGVMSNALKIPLD